MSLLSTHVCYHMLYVRWLKFFQEWLITRLCVFVKKEIINYTTKSSNAIRIWSSSWVWTTYNKWLMLYIIFLWGSGLYVDKLAVKHALLGLRQYSKDDFTQLKKASFEIAALFPSPYRWRKRASISKLKFFRLNLRSRSYIVLVLAS